MKGFVVWADGRSCVGAGGAGRVVGVGEEVVVKGVRVAQGDLVVLDGEGGVCIPREDVGEVMRRLQRWLEGEAKIGRTVEEGGEMGPAVKMYRAKF